MSETTPNLITLGDCIRVFARRTKWTPTDDLAFYDEPPLYDLPSKPIRVSVTFTWDVDKAKSLAYSWGRRYPGRRIEIGGPACMAGADDFVPGRFLRSGITITSRGCPKRCPWCLVSKAEGRLREIPIQPGYIVQDNNLLACSRKHIEKVFDMLRQQNRGIKFSGGLDIDYLSAWHVDLLKTIKVAELWVACDTESALHKLDKARDMLWDFPTEKKRCYVLMGFGDDTPDRAERRCEAVYDKGFLPFAQFYQGPQAKPYMPHDSPWFWVRHKWSRPAIYRSTVGT